MDHISDHLDTRHNLRHIWIWWAIVTATITALTQSQVYWDLWPRHFQGSLISPFLRGAVNGALLGLVQALLLCHFFKGLKWLTWALVVAVGYGVMSLLFVVVHEHQPPRYGHGPYLSLIDQIVLLGFLGVLAGAMQVPMLQRWIPGKGGWVMWWWAAIHGIAWAAGLVGRYLLSRVGIPYYSRVIDGVALGLITGIGLLILVRISCASRERGELT